MLNDLIVFALTNHKHLNTPWCNCTIHWINILIWNICCCFPATVRFNREERRIMAEVAREKDLESKGSKCSIEIVVEFWFIYKQIRLKIAYKLDWIKLAFQFRAATFLCMSQARTWISNVICRWSFCLFSELWLEVVFLVLEELLTKVHHCLYFPFIIMSAYMSIYTCLIQEKINLI